MNLHCCCSKTIASWCKKYILCVCGANLVKDALSVDPHTLLQDNEIWWASCLNFGLSVDHIKTYKTMKSGRKNSIFPISYLQTTAKPARRWNLVGKKSIFFYFLSVNHIKTYKTVKSGRNGLLFQRNLAYPHGSFCGMFANVSPSKNIDFDQKIRKLGTYFPI